MRVSLEWLQSLITLPNDVDLAQEFVRTGTEVEGVERLGADISGVVTSRVVEKVPHPDSDHMFVCKMDVGTYHTNEYGEPELLQVVCGAQNFAAGDITATALVGAHLPGDVHIKAGKLRGVTSNGMNCSKRELGLGGDHAGIWILPKDTPVGVDLCEYLQLTDTVFDLEITPNRPDCLSMLGMAKEVSAIFDIDTTEDALPKLKERFEGVAPKISAKIYDAESCSRYTLRAFENVKVAESPEWLQKRLIAAGCRPINNVVDITNYVMYLTGQPLHAFDLAKLKVDTSGAREIGVRLARDGETIKTLDSQERKLTSDMALIVNNDEPIALAGVMGGENSEVDESTTSVLLESAAFAAGRTSRTSRNLDLMSEASQRYERQVDEYGAADVSDIAAALLLELTGAQLASDLIDVWPKPKEKVVLTLRPKRVCAISGAEIDTDFMVKRLERLGCKVERGENLTVEVPSNRPDLTREIDLVEEVLRLWGEGDVKPTLPAAKNHAGGLTLAQKRLRKMGQSLRASGLSETSTYNFADPKDLERLNMSDAGKGIPIEILRPLVADQSVMRQDMLPGLLRSVAYNLDHGVENVSLYEIGRVFYGHAHKSQPDEVEMLAATMCGAAKAQSWAEPARPLDFFDVKAVVCALLDALKIEKVRFRTADPEAYAFLQPGLGAEILAGGELIGWMGAVHPASLKNFDIESQVFAFELSVAALLRQAKDMASYQDIPTLPGVSVDLALVVDEDFAFEQLMQRIKSAGGKLLDTVELFDVYRDDERVGVGKKSMAFSLTYRAGDRTLTMDEVEKAHAKLVQKVMKSTGGEVRS